MEDDRTRLLNKLVDKTLAGKIAWKSTYEPCTFIASVEGELGLELSKPMDQFVSLKMFGTDGNELDSITEPQPTPPLTSNHPLFKLSRLYNLAKDQALDNSEVVDRLARVERVLDAL